MNGQNLSDRFDDSDYTERNTNSPLVNSDPFAENAPVAAVLVEQTPLDASIPMTGPLDDTIANDTRVVEASAYPAQVDFPVEPVTGDSSPAPLAAPVVNQAVSGANVELSAALLDQDESEHLRTRWNEIQGHFVDEPRSAVQEADALVSDVIEKITKMFTSEHGTLESQWKQGSDVSTEDLRKALQHYRSFFNRLVV